MSDISQPEKDITNGEDNCPAPAKKIRLDNTFSNNWQRTSNNMASGNSEMSSCNGDSIDEGLYSRQLYVLGHEAMSRMAKSSILIAGMGGVGVEIAKNIVLGGVKGVTIQDTKLTRVDDLSSQFFLRESDIGNNRALATLPRLSELNSYVSVDTCTSPLTLDFISTFTVVVLTESNLEEQLELGKFCHSNSIKFVVAGIRGLAGQIFCDFGEKFVVVDPTGVEPNSAMIAKVDKSAEGIVTALDEHRHGFDDGDYVTFKEIEGMVELNNCEPRRIKVTDPYNFSIGNTANFSDYKRGGIAVAVNMPVTMSFKSLEVSLDSPEIIEVDFAKFGRSSLLHSSFRALHVFTNKRGDLPRPRNQEDAAHLLELVKEIHKEGDVDEDVVKEFSYTCRGNLAPMCAVIGGIAAQEVMKACSGKFTPIYQWLYFDAFECLGSANDRSKLTEETCRAVGSRYDAQVAVFGQDMQMRLAALHYFLVGSGAIGCEMLKNWSLMGVSCGESGGMVYITDMDLIEKSNLNRQFLFRPWDVTKLKSTTAAAAAKEMNPSFNVTAHENRVGPETEDVYDDIFMERLDGVANALDNIQARAYMDGRCVYYKKPLLESGTLGTKANVQVVLPDKTESYSSSQDPPEKSIPICTLKNFPNAIEHTLQWARDTFEGLFTQAPMSARQFITDPKFLETTLKGCGSQPVGTLDLVKKFLVTDRSSSFADSVKWARFLFQDYFHNQISQLLYNFPPDQVTTSGALFWSGPKRCPRVIHFDPSDSTHMDFVIAAANLHSCMYGLQGSRDPNVVKDILNQFIVPVFKPTSGVRIAVTDAEASSMGHSECSADELNALRKVIGSPDVYRELDVFVHDFEKDDDSNFHMDFIVACSNLRAANYSISSCDRHKSKLIAGKIIPAIATTTSLVVGLVCLEMYKIIQGFGDISLYKNSFVNLAIPFMTFSEPLPPPKEKYRDVNWTLWDRFEVQGDLTLQQFMDYFKDKYHLEVQMLSYDVAILYSFFSKAETVERRKHMKLTDVIKEVQQGKPLPISKRTLPLTIIVRDLDETDPMAEDPDVPFVRYILPHSSHSTC